MCAQYSLHNPCEVGINSLHFIDEESEYQGGEVAFVNLTPECMYFCRVTAGKAGRCAPTEFLKMC